MSTKTVKGVGKAPVCEIKSMSNPPVAVKQTITTTLLLLGHFEEETKHYKHVQRLIAGQGSDALHTRTAELKVEDVPLNVALGARLWMKDLTEAKVKCVSSAASQLCRWNLEVIEAVLSRYSEDEISKTEPRTKLYNDPPPEQTLQ